MGENKMTLTQKISQIKAGKLTAVANLNYFLKKIKAKNTALNIFLSLNDEAMEQAREIDKRIKAKKKTGKLAGICVAVKSNISVKGLETNCASKVLQDYISPYNATVINNLIEEDAIVIGMVNMDEFACGASGETSAFNPTKNPTNPDLIPGGSSSGSAAAVAADFCDFALGSDTGGSIRNPASHCGVVGLKPSYGAVSRYGLIDLGMSLDVIGCLAKNTEDAELIFNIIKGQDNFDTTTSEQKSKSKFKKTIAIANVKDFCDAKISKLIEDKITKTAEKNKWEIKKIELPLKIALETYYILVYTEFFSATRKFDGRRFGLPIDKYAGPEVQRRIIGGSEITKAEFSGRYYSEAQKSKNFIKEQFKKIFSNCDAIVLPTVPKLAHKIGEKITLKEMYGYDVLTVLANIAGIPAISIPAGKIDNKNIGLQILTENFNEDLLFKLAKIFENV